MWGTCIHEVVEIRMNRLSVHVPTSKVISIWIWSLTMQLPAILLAVAQLKTRKHMLLTRIIVIASMGPYVQGVLEVEGSFDSGSTCCSCTRDRYFYIRLAMFTRSEEQK